jgi:hypothetical protein
VSNLVSLHGLSWPRNKENLKKLKQVLRKRKGVYVLAHGAMPMYVGKGQIARRVNAHARPGSSKAQYWDYFSWFVIDTKGFEGEIETVLLRSLPFYVRSLNKQTGSLNKKNRIWPEENQRPDWIELPRLIRKKRRKKK